MKEDNRWCYGCNEIKPLTPEYWAWANKEHTRFRTKCRKCTNYDSMISHRIHRKNKKKIEEIELYKLLKKYKNKLTRQQSNTIKGQIRNNDLLGAYKGIKKLIGE